MKSDLTQEYLKELLHYNQKTGRFTWAKDRTGVSKGAIAGSFNHYGYRQIVIYGTNYLAHRLAWLYENGEWPSDQIDHINEDKADNKITNLRIANNSQNNRNRGPNKTNKSGYKGVSWSKWHNKWRARINIDEKDYKDLGLKTPYKSLGFFKSKEDAIEVYKQAAKKYHGEFSSV